MIKVEARNKRTGETKAFAEPVWAMLESGGHARRNWDFVRRYSVEVPAEVKGWAGAASEQNDIATIEQPPKQQGKKRRKKTPE